VSAIRALLLVILLAVPRVLWADLRLSLTRTRTTVSSSTLGQTGGHDELSVVLGKDYFWIDLADYRRIYDFRRERIYTLHPASRTYLDDSLQSIVAHREVEMRSRMGLGPFEPIKQIPIGRNRQFELAHLFGMIIEGMDVPEPVEEVRGNPRRFTHQGRLVGAYELGETALPDDLRRVYARFITYECSLHPSIHRKLCQEPRLFKSIREVAHMGDARRVTVLELSEVASVQPADKLVPDGYRLGPEPGNTDPVLAIICSVVNGTAKRPDMTPGKLRGLIDGALKEGHYGQAIVYYFQGMLQFGEEDIELLQKISDAAGNDPEFLLFNVGVRRNSKAQAERAIFALDAIDRSKLKSAWVLDVYKADALSTAGRIWESKALLIKTLRTNPHLAGAYKDLGGILFSTFDMPGAWRCWETCLRLCPKYPLLQRFGYYQERRRKRFPDFF